MWCSRTIYLQWRQAGGELFRVAVTKKRVNTIIKFIARAQRALSSVTLPPQPPKPVRLTLQEGSEVLIYLRWRVDTKELGGGSLELFISPHR